MRLAHESGQFVPVRLSSLITHILKKPPAARSAQELREVRSLLVRLKFRWYTQFDAEQRLKIAKYLRYAEATHNTVVFRQGDAANTLFVVASGGLALYQSDELKMMVAEHDTEGIAEYWESLDDRKGYGGALSYEVAQDISSYGSHQFELNAGDTAGPLTLGHGLDIFDLFSDSESDSDSDDGIGSSAAGLYNRHTTKGHGHGHYSVLY